MTALYTSHLTSNGAQRKHTATHGSTQEGLNAEQLSDGAEGEIPSAVAQIYKRCKMSSLCPPECYIGKKEKERKGEKKRMNVMTISP